MTDDRLVSTRERAGIYDGIASAKPGEPIFPLQGGDPLSAPLIQLWADFARVRAGIVSGDAAGMSALARLCRAAQANPIEPEKRDAWLRRATAAEQAGWVFHAYLKGEVEIAGTRASYNDRDGVADAEHSDRAILIKATDRLHNAVGVATEVVELLAEHRLEPEQEVKVREAIALLREAAMNVEPRRGNERT